MQDLNNFESDPEAFAEGLANDLEIDDPEVAVSSAAPAVAGLSFPFTGRHHRRPKRLIDSLLEPRIGHHASEPCIRALPSISFVWLSCQPHCSPVQTRVQLVNFQDNLHTCIPGGCLFCR